MRGLPAQQRLKKGLFLAISLTGVLVLSACSDIDNMFGDDDTAMSSQLAPPDAGAPPTAGAPTAGPSAYAPSAGVSGAGMMATITPVTIDPGSNTGTAVNRTIQSLRSQVSGLQQKLMTNAQRLADLRNASAASAGA